MSTAIIHKRTSVSGRSPTTASLEYGELAVNTYDGKIFFKYNDGSGDVLATLREISTYSIDDLSDVDLSTAPTSGQVLKWNGSNWVAADDVDTTLTLGNESIGSLGDVDLTGITNGQVLKWDSANSKFIAADDTDTDTGILYTDLSATNASASGSGSLAYNNTNGVFTFTPPDLSSYLTTIDLTSESIDELSDVDTSTVAPTNGQALLWNGSAWAPGTVSTGSGTITWSGGNIEGAVFTYTLSSDTTTVSGADDNGNTLLFNGTAVTVYVNGVRLVNSDDYTASSGTTITFQETIFSGSIVEVIANESLNSDEVSISTTNATAVYTASATKVRSVKLIIQMSHSTGGYHVTEVLVIHNGSTTYDTEYGTIFSSNSLGTVSSQINAGNLEVLVTPVSANTDVRCKVLSIDI